MSESTVLIRLAGPVQGWGAAHAAFEQRPRSPYPTKSALVGMIAACLGRGRADPIEDLAGCVLAVRTDQSGQSLRDYQTIGADGVYTADGKTVRPGKVSVRGYTADGVFTAALGCPTPDLARQVAHALQNPYYAPFLGRKGCLPTEPLLIALSGKDPVTALTTLPYQGYLARPDVVRIIADDPDGHESAADQPVSFDPLVHTVRRVTTIRVALPEPADPTPARVIDEMDETNPYGIGPRP
jgi:CRISPR system Cascade subunit CasD